MPNRGEYLTIHRKWKAGDEITEYAHAGCLRANTGSGKFLCIHVGPIVLASPTGTENMDGLYADDSRGGPIAHGKQISMQEIPMLVGSAASLPQSLRKINDDLVAFALYR